MQILKFRNDLSTIEIFYFNLHLVTQDYSKSKFCTFNPSRLNVFDTNAKCVKSCLWPR